MKRGLILEIDGEVFGAKTAHFFSLERTSLSGHGQIPFVDSVPVDLAMTMILKGNV
ncbi:MAG: hypothetical protein M1313_10915 [Nitrospirae bacterium]|nr:hypothetical protein [Nitrospirota bacterium]